MQSRGGAAGSGGNTSAGLRIRVADYCGAAARVGALTAKDGPPPSIYQSDPFFRGGGGGMGGNGGGNCGDFFQLPPVELSKDGFAFEAKCWSEMNKCSVLLKHVFRQQEVTALMSKRLY